LEDSVQIPQANPQADWVNHFLVQQNLKLQALVEHHKYHHSENSVQIPQANPQAYLVNHFWVQHNLKLQALVEYHKHPHLEDKDRVFLINL